eukprot:SAG31_NODE_2880_length_4958_cov_4.413460_9_plen_70_part_00
MGGAATPTPAATVLVQRRGGAGGVVGRCMCTQVPDVVMSRRARAARVVDTYGRTAVRGTAAHCCVTADS